jgi:hypothetical protein
VRIGFVNFDVQLEGSATVVTEVTGSDMVCGAGLCRMQGSIIKRGVTGSGQTVCVSILSYIYIQGKTVKGTAIYRAVGGAGKDQFGCRERSEP